MEQKRCISSLTLAELTDELKALGQPGFRAKQIFHWVHQKLVTEFSAMTDQPKTLLAKLEETFYIAAPQIERRQEAKDGTVKYLLRMADGNCIETVVMRYHYGNTVCVSTQVGCRMGCRFCATGRQGLPHSLSTNEILNQIGSLPERERLTNVVFMGMGEPLENLDRLLAGLVVLTSAWGFGLAATRMTVSTAGVASRLERFLDATQVHLAVSLHNPFPHERAEIMPVEKAWPIREVVEILRRYDFTHQRRVSFEYIVMSGLNDSPRHIRELCRLLDGIKCRINLIRFHKIPGSPYFSPDDRAMIAFRDALTAKGIHTTIRTSRGEDIQAACGLLSTAQNETAQF